MDYEEIKSVRLVVCDPVGYNDFISVPTIDELPNENIPPQTAYYVESLKIYKAYDNDTEEWAIVNTELSDERIGKLIELHGEGRAKTECLKAILISLGRKMQLVRLKSGADDMTFIDLNDLYNFYKNLLNEILTDGLNNSAGLFMRTSDPPIAGGI